jgi:hypothetical protein
MGIMDTVAEDFDAYIDIACQLANDGDWRKELRNKIKTRAACLYENLEPTRELKSKRGPHVCMKISNPRGSWKTFSNGHREKRR